MDIAKKMQCSIVNIGGKDIMDGKRMLILGMSWQLMRMSILKSLSEIKVGGKALDESGMVAWANEKVGGSADDSKPTMGMPSDSRCAVYSATS